MISVCSSTAAIDPITGYRSYRWDQLGDALCMTTLRDLDIPLDRIGRHLVDGIPLPDVLAGERTRLQPQAARAERALAIIAILREDKAIVRDDIDLITWDEQATLSAEAQAHGDTLSTDATRLIHRLLDIATRLQLDTTPALIGAYPLDLDGDLSI